MSGPVVAQPRAVAVELPFASSFNRGSGLATYAGVSGSRTLQAGNAGSRTGGNAQAYLNKSTWIQKYAMELPCQDACLLCSMQTTS